MNRAGFYSDPQTGEREFLVLPEVFRRGIYAGFDSRAATRWLFAHGWLVPGTNGNATQKPRLKGFGTDALSRRHPAVRRRR
jgi:putative DNA primase/helicase